MKEFNDIEDLEQLLKPQCEFHASDTLKDEVIAKAKAEVRPRKVRLLPWLAAACVAGVIGLFLMPPEQSEEGVKCKVEGVKCKVEDVRCKVERVKNNCEADGLIQTKHKDTMPKPSVAVAGKKHQVKPSVKVEESVITHHPSPNAQHLTELYGDEEEMILSEYDIPITRPENLIDTPEDLAQIAKLKKRAFINRMREQVEIAKAELVSEIQVEEN